MFMKTYNNKPLFHTSKVMTYIYKYLLPAVIIIFILAINKFNIFMLSFFIAAYVILWFIFLNVDFHENYMIINRFFRKEKIEYSFIHKIYQSKLISPTIVIIIFKNKLFPFYFLISIMPPKNNGIKLVSKEPIVDFIIEWIGTHAEYDKKDFQE